MIKQFTITPPQVLRFLLLAVIFFYIFFLVSHSFDFDLGWHLRFGKEMWEEHRFPYYDTYTWPHYGQKWVNHEWGGDALLWLLYSQFGYIALMILMSFAVWGSLILVQRIFFPRISTLGLVVGLFAAWSVKHIMVMRLALLGPIFLVALWYTLERLPDKKRYYAWPVILWLWSILHGSWILGFIVINIYIFGNLAQRLLQQYTTLPFPKEAWPLPLIFRAIVWQLVAAAVITLNPYGVAIWKEILHYFSASYFKAWITEWLPTYTPPIFWNSLPIVGFGLFALIVAWRKKALTLAQLLLGIAFFISALQYKRNILFFALISIPLLTAGLHYIIQALRQTTWWQKFFTDARLRGFFYAYGIAATLLLLVFYTTQLPPKRDIWEQPSLLEEHYMPVAATEFLKTRTRDQNIYLFNYFSWGGYLIWELPEALIFLDGRGTVTWQVPETQENSLAYYSAILTEPEGLRKLEQGPTNYILLKKENYFILPPLSSFDRLVFTDDHPPTVYRPLASQIFADLSASKNWIQVYSDDRAAIWERVATSTTRQD